MGSMRSREYQNLQCEIVIIGAGGAGLSAAVAAAENGANVTLLEKKRVPGGNSALARGLFGAESPAQERMRLDVRCEELFKIAMEHAHWKINPRIVRAFLEKSGDTIRWLEEKGMKFDIVRFPTQAQPVYHCPRGVRGRGGAKIIKMLLKNSKDLGVKFFSQTSAKKILVEKGGKIAGVLAETRGKDLRIIAKKVIIAAGGYGGNRELLKKYYPHYTKDLHYMGVPVMGDGLIMATEIGAATEDLGILLLHGPVFPGPHRLWGVSLEPYTIWVNKKGERFIDESWAFAPFDTSNAQDRQPERVSYSLFDGKMKQNIIKEGVKRGLGASFMPGTTLPDLERQLQLQVNKGLVMVSNSWNDIANWIGTSPKILKSTVEKYNLFCDHGYDEIFAKDRRFLLPLRTPPYYAMKFIQGFLDTLGGIKVNQYMEVVNHRDEPISGLYAAGVNVGGWESDTYCSMLSGSAFGFAINSGRIAGENAAKRIA